jgi:maltose phosphorylase
MIKYLKTDPWKIVEEDFHPQYQRSSESIFSIGNGRFGQRANHEEKYSGESLSGSYIAGVYYPDKTRVGWWKNGYPEYFAKVLNSTNWIGIDITINGEELDLAKVKVESFVRELDMQNGILARRFVAIMSNGQKVKIEAERFCSMANDSCAAIRYSVTPINGAAEVSFSAYLNGDVKNHDSNYNEMFWDEVAQMATSNCGLVITKTRKTGFEVAVAMQSELAKNAGWNAQTASLYASCSTSAQAAEGTSAVFYKYIGIVSSLNAPADKVGEEATKAAAEAANIGYDQLKAAHCSKWASIWDLADIQIDGDEEAQQGIRFNIFQLNQTYTGEDARLNIGPKGFTGEKYGGSTYWDTEAYCLSFYMSTKSQEVARQLLVYRFQHLQQAIKNAEKLGFTNGAALYPMVTMNGEECHNEWEITFEEIHRNGAIAYGIFNYVNYTGDSGYLADCGWDVLLGIARFWAQRFNWSTDKKAYVMLGVTGPNEYENNVNNNWYTSYIARWCLQYALESMQYLKREHAQAFTEKSAAYSFLEAQETEKWKHIIANTYFPVLEGTNIFLQQDGFMDKEQLSVSDLNPTERPINQHWSWDRILRSIFIKQADVLQGLYFFEDQFSEEVIRQNFDFYEPKTVHESSLSPCVHAILAAKLGYEEKAYEMYLRTSRLDLDDYNHEAHEGLHITSMAGTWMSVVQGFGGMRVIGNELHFQPILPAQWTSYSFNVLFRNQRYEIKVTKDGHQISVR